MAYVITGACLDQKHMRCVRVCPIQVIRFEPEDRMVYIDQVECIDCRACWAECPTGAIVGPPDPGFDATKDWARINDLWHHDKEAARRRLDTLVPRQP